MSSDTTVSYTHLDVYKRQSIHSQLVPTQGITWLFSCLGIIPNNINLRDVYKRQGISVGTVCGMAETE